MYRYSEDISKGFLAIPPSIHRPCSKISRDLQAWILSRDELVVRLNTNGFICKEKNRERKRRGREEGQTASQISLLFSLPRLLSPSSFFRNQNPTLKHSTLLDKDTVNLIDDVCIVKLWALNYFDSIFSTDRSFQWFLLHGHSNCINYDILVTIRNINLRSLSAHNCSCYLY